MKKNLSGATLSTLKQVLSYAKERETAAKKFEDTNTAIIKDDLDDQVPESAISSTIIDDHDEIITKIKISLD